MIAKLTFKLKYYNDYLFMHNSMEYTRRRQELRNLRYEEFRRFRRRSLRDNTMCMLRWRYGREMVHRSRANVLPHNAQSTSNPPGTVTIEIRRNSFMPYDAEANATREVTSRPSIQIRNPHLTENLENNNNVEQRSTDDEDLPSNIIRHNQESNIYNERSQLDDSHSTNSTRPGIDERTQRTSLQDTEGRISSHYQNLVDQYVTLVRHYFDASRNRDTVSYIHILILISC